MQASGVSSKMNESNPSPATELPRANGSGTQFIKRKRILIADSDGFNRTVLMLLLRMVGFAVDFSANGSMAMRKFRSRLPDALLVDLKLNGMSGLELIRAAQAEPQFS